jgi:signal transduction histidine kinase
LPAKGYDLPPLLFTVLAVISLFLHTVMSLILSLVTTSVLVNQHKTMIQLKYGLFGVKQQSLTKIRKFKECRKFNPLSHTIQIMKKRHW